MHDVTKRGLALAVATGGLLITGAAPAISAVSPHPEHAENAGTKSQPTGASSHQAGIPISGTQVQQYAGRHKAPEQHAAALHAAASRSEGASQHAMAPQHSAAPHSTAARQHAAAPRHQVAAHHLAAVQRGGVKQLDSAPSSGAGPDTDAAGSSAQSASTGSGGLLSGNTIEAPINAPVNVCGLVATVLGDGDQASGENCANGPGAAAAGGPSTAASAAASGSPGALSGNVVQVPVSLPTNICGDNVTAVGAQNSAEDILCANNGGGTSSTATAVASDSPGLVTGNVVQVPVNAPLNVCGITASVVGVDNTTSGNSCANGGSSGPSGTAGPSAQAATANSSGAVAGNVVQVPIEAPINACGDTVSVVGALDSASGNQCANNTAGGAAATGQAAGSSGLGTGNVAQLPIDIPTNVCGVVGAVGAYGATATGNTCVNTGGPATTSSAGATGGSGLVAGNVVQGSVNTPVQVCGTTVGALFTASGSQGNTCATGPVTPAAPVSFPQPPPPAVLLPSFPPPVTPVTPGRPTPDAPTPPLTPAVPVRNFPQPAAESSSYGQLAHTGADVLDYGAIGAGALALGAGAVFASRRKSSSAR